MQRYRFQWRGAYYRVDPAAIATWPDARIIVPPDPAMPPRIVPTHHSFLNFARAAGCPLDEAIPPDTQFDTCLQALKARGYQVGSIPQAVALVEQWPESDLASITMAVLVQGFFIAKELQ